MSRSLLRVASVVTALFAAGHTLGATHPRTDGALAAVVAAMQSVRFDLAGAQRSYWDMYEGYGYLIAFAALAFRYFFWVPGVMNAISAACAAAAPAKA